MSGVICFKGCRADPHAASWMGVRGPSLAEGTDSAGGGQTEGKAQHIDHAKHILSR